MKWLSETGVTTIVEMNESFQSISMTTSHLNRKHRKYLELAQSVISFIKDAHQGFCPHVEVLEVISCPPESVSDHSDCAKVELSLLKKAFLEVDGTVLDISGEKCVVIEEWMKIEPCLPYLVGGEAIGGSGYMWVTSPLSYSVYFCGHLLFLPATCIVRAGRTNCATFGRYVTTHVLTILICQHTCTDPTYMSPHMY